MFGKKTLLLTETFTRILALAHEETTPAQPTSALPLLPPVAGDIKGESRGPKADSAILLAPGLDVPLLAEPHQKIGVVASRNQISILLVALLPLGYQRAKHHLCTDRVLCKGGFDCIMKANETGTRTIDTLFMYVSIVACLPPIPRLTLMLPVLEKTTTTTIFGGATSPQTAVLAASRSMCPPGT
jgi:hypothetical protein